MARTRINLLACAATLDPIEWALSRGIRAATCARTRDGLRSADWSIGVMSTAVAAVPARAWLPRVDLGSYRFTTTSPGKTHSAPRRPVDWRKDRLTRWCQGVSTGEISMERQDFIVGSLRKRVREGRYTGELSSNRCLSLNVPRCRRSRRVSGRQRSPRTACRRSGHPESPQGD